MKESIRLILNINTFLLLSLLGISCTSIKTLTTRHPALIAKYVVQNDSILDESPNQVNLVPIHTKMTEDRFGNTNSAIIFNGTSSKIEFNSDNRGISDEVTVIAWVKTKQGDFSAIVTKYDWREDKGFCLRLRDEGEAAIEGRDGNGKFQRSGQEGSLYDDQWHHIVGVINRNEWTIYVDGEMNSTSTNENLSVDLSNTSVLTIGALSVPNGEGNYRFFDGVIDEVLIYNIALKGGQIKKIYQKSKIEKL